MTITHFVLGLGIRVYLRPCCRTQNQHNSRHQPYHLTGIPRDVHLLSTAILTCTSATWVSNWTEPGLSETKHSERIRLWKDKPTLLGLKNAPFVCWLKHRAIILHMVSHSSHSVKNWLYAWDPASMAQETNQPFLPQYKLKANSNVWKSLNAKIESLGRPIKSLGRLPLFSPKRRRAAHPSDGLFYRRP